MLWSQWIAAYVRGEPSHGRSQQAHPRHLEHRRRPLQRLVQRAPPGRRQDPRPLRPFEGVVTIAEDPLQSKVEATVQTTSIDTGDEGRDNHLRTGDFFEAETYPTLTFVSTSITPDGDDYELAGDLTIKGVTKPVTWELEFNGVVTDPWGNTRAGFSAETEVNRKEWGLDYNAVLEAGGVMIGEKVKLSLEVEAVKAS